MSVRIQNHYQPVRYSYLKEVPKEGHYAPKVGKNSPLTMATFNDAKPILSDRETRS